ncbi:NAD(P)/FAD-dependent oxidoreductase [Treponema phagedenis]|uniref:NAD(P)/FAD-dependent oxidoreductase n=2 Tax=Treponema phagedenis TaxID=162 RepID=A0AAE6IVV9_TREPH|nr:NAD(P)/FAD-dependent oxidoreductase [Treponema phagedenis]QEJ99173.1 NAD(P)/FAD-dependent oxidoreductase [Treponema phagedenis]QEK00199.1 NAD(P)/FAD-dependent oxidoreductase [Treponema phagedenis]QEK04701.1 NAD(P)/FAD-dependent oxidoreductase [Treponema phagedenis]QEK07693.1 NAD(P)/FAD-dependent oxidoreductase [Treponema phagedenis]
MKVKFPLYRVLIREYSKPLLEGVLTNMEKPRIVVLGAGYAGMRTVKCLQDRRLNMEIILVDKNDYHYEATCIHEVAAGDKTAEQISYKIADVINPKSVTFIQDTVVSISANTKSVVLENNEPLTYDYLVVALGFESETFGIEGVKEHTLELVNLKTAERIRQHLEERFNRYVLTKDDNDLHIIVCGAGFTSIEFVGALLDTIPEYSRQYDFPQERVQITCVEALPNLLPMFHKRLIDYAIKYLRSKNVTILLDAPISKVNENEVQYKRGTRNDSLRANTIVWTTGVRGSSIIGNSGFLEKRGRVSITDFLTHPEHEEIFFLGDVAAFINMATNRPFPTTAQIAIAMGESAAANIANKIRGRSLKPFIFRSKGSVCSIGNTVAFGEVFGINIKGYIASAMKKMIANISLFKTGGLKILFQKGRFDLWR